MAHETKLGMFVITILVFTFGFLVYRKVDMHHQKLQEARIPSPGDPATDQSGTGITPFIGEPRGASGSEGGTVATNNAAPGGMSPGATDFLSTPGFSFAEPDTAVDTVSNTTAAIADGPMLSGRPTESNATQQPLDDWDATVGPGTELLASSGPVTERPPAGTAEFAPTFDGFEPSATDAGDARIPSLAMDDVPRSAPSHAGGESLPDFASADDGDGFSEQGSPLPSTDMQPEDSGRFTAADAAENPFPAETSAAVASANHEPSFEFSGDATQSGRAAPGARDVNVAHEDSASAEGFGSPVVPELTLPADREMDPDSRTLIAMVDPPLSGAGGSSRDDFLFDNDVPRPGAGPAPQAEAEAPGFFSELEPDESAPTLEVPAPIPRGQTDPGARPGTPELAVGSAPTQLENDVQYFSPAGNGSQAGGSASLHQNAAGSGRGQNSNRPGLGDRTFAGGSGGRGENGQFNLTTFNYQHDNPATGGTSPGDDVPCEVAVVQNGDNYWSISRRVYGTPRYFSALAVFNQHRITDPKKMRPGMKVLVPPAELLEARYPQLFEGQQPREVLPAQFLLMDDGSPAYRVGERETLSEISARFLGRSSRWIEIYRLNQNKLKDPNSLKPGTILALPVDAVEVNVIP